MQLGRSFIHLSRFIKTTDTSNNEGGRLRPKKRVTKNDKKQKREVYSQKYVRTVLKHLEGKLTNAPEREDITREGVRPTEVRGMAKTKGKNAHGK